MSKPTCHDARKGQAYRGSDGAVTCLLCDHEMEWEDCGHCNGDGELDGYEEDPINYSPGEGVRCHMCGGSGGDYWCTTDKCPTSIAIKIHPEKPAHG